MGLAVFVGGFVLLLAILAIVSIDHKMSVVVKQVKQAVEELQKLNGDRWKNKTEGR